MFLGADTNRTVKLFGAIELLQLPFTPPKKELRKRKKNYVSANPLGTNHSKTESIVPESLLGRECITDI